MTNAVKAAADPLLGTIIDDRYRILRVIGRGGMGVVYEAEATRLGDRLCAVKVLLPEFTRDETAVARFRREAQVAARVKHPNVVEIFDTGTTAGGLGYIAMEMLAGESLDRLLERQGSLPWSRAQPILLQICRALAVAHGQKIVHRDMKPENCFVCPTEDGLDFIKVLDFGIAKRTTTEDPGIRLTATNSIIGTCAYMSFEQVRGEAVDHRADIWAVGVIMYEILTGLLPFRGQNQGQVWTAITLYEAEPLRNVAPGAAIPEAVEAVVRQALAKSLSDRYPTIEAMGRAIAGIQPGPEVPNVHRGPAAATAKAIDPLAMTSDAAAPATLGDTAEVARTMVSPRTNPYGHAGVAVPRGVMETAKAESPEQSVVPTRSARPKRRSAVMGIAALMTAAAVVGGFQLLRGPDTTATRPSPSDLRADPGVPAAPAVVPASLPAEPRSPKVEASAAQLAAPDAAPAPGGPSVVTPTPAPATKTRRPPAPTAPKALPELATVEQLRASIKRQRAALDRCRESGGYAGMRLQAVVTVAPNGAVTSARMQKPYDATEVGRCVADVLRSLKLPRSTTGGELSDLVTL